MGAKTRQFNPVKAISLDELVPADHFYRHLEQVLDLTTALEREAIHAYMPLPDWEHQRDYYGPRQFTYDPEHDVYVCPQGQQLRPYHVEYLAKRVEYRGEPATCNACPDKAQCTSSNQGRQVHRTMMLDTDDALSRRCLE